MTVWVESRVVPFKDLTPMKCIIYYLKPPSILPQKDMRIIALQRMGRWDNISRPELFSFSQRLWKQPYSIFLS